MEKTTCLPSTKSGKYLIFQIPEKVAPQSSKNSVDLIRPNLTRVSTRFHYDNIIEDGTLISGPYRPLDPYTNPNRFTDFTRVSTRFHYDNIEQDGTCSLLGSEFTDFIDPYEIKKKCFWSIPILTFTLMLIIAFQFLYPAWAKESRNEIGNNTATVTNQNETDLVKAKMTNVPEFTYSVDYAHPIIVRLHINSVQSALPTNLVSTSKYLPIHLKITTTVNYDWSQWSPSRPQQIKILTLEGCLSEAGIHHFLNTLTNLTTLNLSKSCSPCLCEAFKDPEPADLAQEKVGQRLELAPTKFKPLLIYENIEETYISTVGGECDHLYKSLSTLHFPNLKRITFDHPYVVATNKEYFEGFLLRNQYNLKNIQFIQAALCATCDLFYDNKKWSFHKLEIAHIYFNGLASSLRSNVKTVISLSFASPNLNLISTNLVCEGMDTQLLLDNWKHLDSGKSQLCTIGGEVTPLGNDYHILTN